MSNPIFRGLPQQAGQQGPIANPQPEQFQHQHSLSPEQLQEMYGMPSATPVETQRMTYDDVIMKSAAMFALVVAGAVVGWMFPALIWPGLIVGLVFGLVGAFKRKISKAVYFTYAIGQGLAVGGISGVLEAIYPGIVIQAVLATFAVFAVVLILFSSGKIRATAKMTKFFLIAIGAYFLFSLLNVGLMFTGTVDGMWGMHSMPIDFLGGMPLGLILGPIVILMATFSLLLDFTSIKAAIDYGAPAQEGWRSAFGLTVTMVWLYLEILRFLALIMGRD